MANLSDLLSLSSEEKVILFDEILGVIMKRGDKTNVEKPRHSSNKQQSTSNFEENLSRRESKPKKYEHVSELSQEDNPCFDALKRWRNQVAKDIDWPAYMVLDNKTLMSIAHYKPQTDEELLKIKGLGPEKLGRYSNAIFDIVKSCSIRYQRKIPPNTKEKRFLGTNSLVYISDNE